VGRWGKGGSWLDKGGGGRKGGEMTQTLYAHMNKRKKKMPVAGGSWLATPETDQKDSNLKPRQRI
jgi:hypothetical protein